jgi:dUTPase
MEELEVFVTRSEGVPLPDYRTVASSGMDLKARLDAPVTLKPRKSPHSGRGPDCDA